MKTKKIAEKPAVVSEGVAGTAAAPKKARAPRATSSATTHKHKKAAIASAEPAPEIEQTPIEVAGPTHEQIAVRAYLLAEARGFTGGSPADDWFQAERQLLEELRSRA